MNLLVWLGHNIFRPAFWFQPLFYAGHGWLATEMALWMLFHPYTPQYVPGTKWQLPFTPGIFPRGRHKLSISIANTITEILLTRADIKKQAEKLITEDNIYQALDMLMTSVGTELRDIQHIRRIYRSVDQLVPAILEKLVQDGIQLLEDGKTDGFDAFIETGIDRLVPYVQCSPPQAEALASWVIETILTPARLRAVLIANVTSENLSFLDAEVRRRVGPVQGLLLRFLDIQKIGLQCREFLSQHPEEADVMIAQLVVQLQLQEKLTQAFLQVSAQQLPLETLLQLKQTLQTVLKSLFIERRADIILFVSQASAEVTHSMTHHILHLDFQQISTQWLPGFKKDTARFAFTYLNKELENMLSKALPAISLNQVIIDKIDQFSAKQLEETIQGICRRELRLMAFLGAFLGFWLGIISNFIAFWWHPLMP